MGEYTMGGYLWSRYERGSTGWEELALRASSVDSQEVENMAVDQLLSSARPANCQHFGSQNQEAGVHGV